MTKAGWEGKIPIKDAVIIPNAWEGEIPTEDVAIIHNAMVPTVRHTEMYSLQVNHYTKNRPNQQ